MLKICKSEESWQLKGDIAGNNYDNKNILYLREEDQPLGVVEQINGRKEF